MIQALIIDDELKARNILHHYIVNFIPAITEIKQAASVDEALNLLDEYKPDIVFLDVEMPHKNGFDFLTALKNPSFDVIFTTAYNQYAIQAIRFSALDYLLKPVDPDELKAAVDRHVEKKDSEEQKKNCMETWWKTLEKGSKRFSHRCTQYAGRFLFTIDEVIRMEADTSYTHIHLVNKKPFIASKTLKHFEDMLEGFHFIRTHKSHLVNARHITRVTGDHDFVLLTDGSKVEISRRKKEEVFQQLKLK